MTTRVTATAPTPPTSTIPEGAVDLSVPVGVFPPRVLTGFQAVSGCQVAVQPRATTPAGVRRQRGNTDLVALRADRVRTLAAVGLLVPLDAGAVDGLGAVASRLRSLQAASLNGRSYAVPYGWQPLVLLSRDDAFPDGPPTSLRVLWEPAHTPEVAVPADPLTLATAALSVGVDDAFALDPSDLAAADGLMRLANPGFRWDSIAILRALFASGQVELALGSPRVAHAVPGGTRVTATLPSEGAVGLAYVLAMPRGAPHPVCAYRFLSYVLEPAIQAAIAVAAGLTPVVPAACRALGRRRCLALHATDQWGPKITFARRPLAPAAPWTRWVADWLALGR